MYNYPLSEHGYITGAFLLDIDHQARRVRIYGRRIYGVGRKGLYDGLRRWRRTQSLRRTCRGLAAPDCPKKPDSQPIAYPHIRFVKDFR